MKEDIPRFFLAPTGLAPVEQKVTGYRDTMLNLRDPEHPRSGCENARVFARASARAPNRATR